MWTISIPHRREFQAHATTGTYILYYCVSPKLSFPDQNIKLGLCTHGNGFRVSINRPPRLRFRTREVSSRPLQLQWTQAPPCISTRELDLLAGETTPRCPLIFD
jgi:hypothetical protein